MPEPLLSVHDLRKSFGSLDVLNGISFDVAAGQKIAMIGGSGSGKSTCLRCINFLEQPSAGEIRLEGQRIGHVAQGAGQWRRMSERELAVQRAAIGMVFQHFYLWPHLTARENVAIAPAKVRGMSRKAAEDLADAMLDKVHMAHKSDEYPERLSGGQQQRVAIARALAQEPKLLLFDEPTSALDPELIGEVLRVIEELASEGRSMVLVTHEIRFARQLADHILFLDRGVIIEEGPPAQVIDAPRLERTRAFLHQVHDQKS